MKLTEQQILITVIIIISIISIVFIVLYLTRNKCQLPTTSGLVMRSPPYSSKKSSEYKRNPKAQYALRVGKVPILKPFSYSDRQRGVEPNRQHLAKVQNLPQNFDWRDVKNHSLYPKLVSGNYCSDVKNQHNPIYAGTCWIFSSLQTMADRFNIMNGIEKGHNNTPKFDLSVQQIVNCGGPDIGALTGGDSFTCYDFVMDNKGIVDTSCSPYTARTEKDKCLPECYTCLAVSQNKCSEIGETEFTPYGNKRCCKVNNYSKYQIEGFSNISKRFENEVQNNSNGWTSSDSIIDYIKTEIYSYGPVTIALDASPIETAKAGSVFIKRSSSSYSPELNHLVAIVGYGNDGKNDYWIIRNSWGTFWADSGYLNIDVSSVGLNDKSNDFFAAYPLGYTKTLGVKASDINVQ